MSDYRKPISAEFDITLRAGADGLSPEYRVDDNDGNTVIGPTASGVTENPGNIGVYSATIEAPGTVGDWSVVWSRDGSWTPVSISIDSLETYDPGVSSPTTPDLPPIDTDSPVGPCQAWTTAELVAECCGAEVGTDLDALDEVAVIASQTLYALVPRFSGVCGPRRVRPCVTGRCGVFWDLPVQWTGLGWGLLDPTPVDPRRPHQGCGCVPVDAIPLAGYVQEVLEVTIDGAIIPSSQYEVRRNRDLVRLYDDDGNAAFWPSCQDDRADHESAGTFSVLYTYGVPPPPLGTKAASELACAVWNTCAGSGGQAATSDCVLPSNVTKVVRQGITMELDAFVSFAYDDEKKRWRTGLPVVDLFLNAYNPRGRRKRRTGVASPDLRRYPRPEAVEAGS